MSQASREPGCVRVRGGRPRVAGWHSRLDRLSRLSWKGRPSWSGRLGGTGGVGWLGSVVVWIGLLVVVSGVGAGQGSRMPASGVGTRSEAVADRVVVEKRAHLLTLWRGGRPFRAYKVALGRGGLGPKVRQGDDLVPEGRYRIDGRNAQSAYHLALHISYPGPADIARARRLGVPPGGDIMIHGLPNHEGWIGAAHRLHDWTKGCIAVTDEEIEEIWRLVPQGTPIEIRP